MQATHDVRRRLMVEPLRDVGFPVSIPPQGASSIIPEASRETDESYAFAFEVLEKAGSGFALGVDFGQASRP